MFITTLKKSILPILCISVGLLLGRFSKTADSPLSYVDGEQRDNEELHEGGEGYRYINPLLLCSSLENISNRDINTMKETISKRVHEVLLNHKATHISVYFRDLSNGPWFGLGEKDVFVPGSLLKVPFMIALYKIAETDPSFLSRSIKYEGGHLDFSEYFKPDELIKKGEVYTVDELIRRMIIYSDNYATLLLSELVPNEIIESTYLELGINAPKDSNYTMTVRTYASFFRILYNGTYLAKEFSEKALELLDQSRFSRGIASSLPKDIVVADKFGEREQTGDTEKQLHDCGIIYYPDQPYLLCVMTRGADYESLAEVISNISSLVYEGVRHKGD